MNDYIDSKPSSKSTKESPKKIIKPKLIHKMAIAIDSSIAFTNFFQSQRELYTHIVPINIIAPATGEQILINNDSVTPEIFEKNQSKLGQHITTSQPTIGQIQKVITEIETSKQKYHDAFFLCINAGGSGYYKSLMHYLKQHKVELHCKYWVFSLNTALYSGWWILNQLNRWVKRGISAKTIYKKLQNLDYREILIALPIYMRKVKGSGRFNQQRFSKQLISLIHVKFLVILTFASLSYKYRVFKIGVTINILCKSLGRFIRKKKKYQHVILYYCIRDQSFFAKKLQLVKKFSQNPHLKFYLVQMPVCYYALFYKNYMFGLYMRAPAKLPFVEKYAVKVKLKRKKVSK